ncbi:MAG: spermidine synthase [Halioglobus sp.]|jgi:spermidine synthase
MINRILLSACFLSGAASLFYEILWTRAFALILGSTVQAASLVFAAFLTGLALGAWLFGGLSGRLKQPLKIYALLEIGIACSAVATGLILHNQADAIGAALGDGALRYGLAFGLAVVMVLLPTLLMGGTLPILLSVARRNDASLSIVGRFYGWNTFGAAAGTLACGFLSIRLLGVTQSYYLAMCINLLVAIMSFALVRHARSENTQETNGEQTTAGLVVSAISESYLLLLAGFSGAVVLSLEVIWARFAGFLLGNRTYAFTLLMFTVLTLLAAGAWLSARLYRSSLGQQHRNPYGPFANLLALSALAIALSAIGGWWLIENQASMEAGLPQVQQYIIAYRFLEAFSLLALPLLFLGALFPLTIAQSKHCSDDIGKTAARFYVFNAVGVVLGSLGTGFVGITLLGSYGMFKLLIALLLVLVLYSLFLAGRPMPRLPPIVALAALVALLFVPASYPPVLEAGETLVLETEDEHGVFRLMETSRGNFRVTNNQVELVYHLGAFSTDFVQQMQGHLGMHFNPEAKKALVIGSGYGITAGALALYDSIEHVDAVELLPSMVVAADQFMPNNFGYHKNPKVRVTVGDGRHFLARQNELYDVITLNVSDPHLPGGATLFHTDFYEVVKQHLNPGGVMIQHVFGSERAIIANTLVAAFPHSRFSQSYSNGYNVVASMEDLEGRSPRRMNLPPEAIRQLESHDRRRRITIPSSRKYEALGDDMRSDIVASDDFPAVEFSWNAGEKALFINE